MKTVDRTAVNVILAVLSLEQRELAERGFSDADHGGHLHVAFDDKR